MESKKNSRIWNHILFIITGVIGTIYAFVSEQTPAFDSFYLINVIIILAYVIWGTVGWYQVRYINQPKYFWIYFLGQGLFIYLQFGLTLYAYREPQISLFVFPVVYQMARISFYGLRFAWWVFLLILTSANLMISGQITVVTIEYFLFQLFFIGTFLAAGKIVQRQIDQSAEIQTLASNLEAGNYHLTRHVNQIEAIHADEIQRFQAIDTMRKELLDSTTHDIRNPLGIIMSYAHLVEAKGEELSDADLKAYADGIIETADRIKSLLSGLLDYTQLETGQAIQKEPILINGFIEKLVRDMKVVATQKKIDLQLTLSPLDFEINLDPDQMYRVFENLINNSIKFTPKGGTIRLFITGDDQKIVVSVQDTGIGIPTEALPHIFKPFYRLRKKDRKKTDGAGLGLAIVNSIVKHHGGEIQVESEVGVGSTFKIMLPL